MPRNERDFGVLVAASLTYLALTLCLPETLRGPVSDLLLVASMVLSAVLMVRVSGRLEPRRARPWRYAAASSVSSAAIFVVWFVYELSGRAVPVPSAADVPYFLAVGLLIPAVLSLRTQDQQGRDGSPSDADTRGRLVLDGAIYALALLIVSWHVVIGSTLAGVTTFSVQSVVLTLYPLADVVAVTIALIIGAHVRAAHRRTVGLMIAGVLCLAAGDIAYGYLSLSGGWSPGHPATLLWFVGYPLMLFGCFEASNTDYAAVSRQTRSRLALLMAPVALAVLVTAVVDPSQTELLALAGLVLLALLRQTAGMFSELELRDSLERKVAEQTRELREQVFRDSVTGLGNRTKLREAASATQQASRTNALLLVDLDGFKEVNDTLGHQGGDEVLTEVGRRLEGLTRTQDTVVRMGGDEFALFLPDVDQYDAVTVSGRILAALRAPRTYGSTSLSMRGSIGIALADSSYDVDELVRQADLAMYEAKAAGGDQALVFNVDMHRRLSERLQVDAAVREATEAGLFVPYYQALVSSETGRVCGLEALVRWDHPERGVLSPHEFLGAAERTGAIVDIGASVLLASCRQVAQWRRQWPDLTVSVNLSHRELFDPRLRDRVADTLAVSGLPAHALHLEITETVLASSGDIHRVLDRLAALGVSFSLDDFGTGHSSLSRLRDLPVRRIKIDRSFTAEIAGGRAPLLASVIALAHSLGHIVVAEGVETTDQRDFLARHGCEELQGFLFSKPVASNEMVAVLHDLQQGTGDWLDHTGVRRPEESSLPELMTSLTTDANHTVSAIRTLLAELSSLARLETAFVTTVLDGEQVTRLSHNCGTLEIPEGLTVPWSDTLCRRLTRDGIKASSNIVARYGDLAAVRDLGIATYVSVPIQDEDGGLVGTLCAASNAVRDVDDAVISLMQVFARVLADRIPELSAVTPDGDKTAPTPTQPDASR